MVSRPHILRVALATETRAEYWLLRPIYRALEEQRRCQPTFLASGMHHLARFGRSIDAIRADGVRVRSIRTAAGNEDNPAARAKAIGRAVTGFARELIDFDWLIVLGDRVEMLAAAVAATALGKPIAHLHGGDVAPGSRDDAVRHAITKLAHLHFPASADAARRIRRLGEPAWRIVQAGAPAIDAMRQMVPVKKKALDRRVGFDTGKPFALVVQHAAGFDPRQERDFLLGTLRAVAEQFNRAVVIGPGLDPGSSQLHRTIRDFLAKKKPTNSGSWAFFPTLDQPDYFGLLSSAAVLVGNSSSGIIEAASFRRPVVNVGPRQRGRLCSGNVIHCEYGKLAVSRAISRALHDRRFLARLTRCRSAYGGGQAGPIVARTLAGTPIDRRLLVKETK